MGALDHINRDEFQNFRQDVNEHFRALQECDRRIERKLDELAALLEPVINDYNESRENRQTKRRNTWEVRMLVLGAALGAGFSAMTAVVLLLLRVPN